MSRSNHYYYRICDGPVNAEGFCPDHAESPRRGHPCLFEHAIVTRRGVFRRRKRFPLPGLAAWRLTPPAAWKKIWRRLVRARQLRELRRHPNDPVLAPGNRLIETRYWY